jgi:predicted nuclease with TOPRIM domain
MASDTDLKELKELVNSGFDRLEKRMQTLEMSQARLEEQVKAVGQRFGGLEKRVDDINAQLNIITIGFLSILGVLVTEILAIVGKLDFFPASNPWFRTREALYYHDRIRGVS